MDAKQKMEALVAYERIDMPKDKKQQAGWSMYLAEKIVNYVGARELSLLMNLPLPDGNKGPNVISVVVFKLLHG